MSKELVKGLIDLVPDKDIETIYQFIIKFIPEDEPMEDEIIAIKVFVMMLILLQFPIKL